MGLNGLQSVLAELCSFLEVLGEYGIIKNIKSLVPGTELFKPLGSLE